MLRQSNSGVPLYRQVRDVLVSRIANQELSPGQILPSEFALAAELGVSQGTVRKALDMMEADHLIFRKQGRGTFVAEQTPERALFHFFSLVGTDDTPLHPETVREDVTHRPAPKRVSASLGVERDAMVVRIRRTRAIKGVPALFEDIFVPFALMPIPAGAVLPNALYNHYQVALGVSILRAEDRLAAEMAPDRVVKALPEMADRPMLVQRRIAYDLLDRAVEYREGFVDCSNTRYAVTVR
jgi:GntR family transcriptional regulator